jgi:hypothetical protein
VADALARCSIDRRRITHFTAPPSAPPGRYIFRCNAPSRVRQGMALCIDCGTTRLDSTSHCGASRPTPPSHGVPGRNRHAEPGRPHTGRAPGLTFRTIVRMLTSIRACLHANAVENAAVDVTHCSPSAGKPPCVPDRCVHLADDNSQCTKAGKECVFFDHGRDEFLPRR